MKLVIEIDKDRYEDTKRIASVQMNYRKPTIEQIVANGTPLEQEPKTGHWDSRTCKCSECGYQIAFSEYAERKYKYCPNCGADMRGEQE